jgi:hypothetical protein
MLKKKINQSLLLLVLATTLFGRCSKDDAQVNPDFNITSIMPESGVIGAQVLITGKGFAAQTSDNKVFFNGVEATISNGTTTELIVLVPVGATTGTVSVKSGTNTTNGPVFTITEPKVTQKYFIKFKADGVVKIFQTGNPGYQTCGNCACGGMPPLDDNSNADLIICQANGNSITAANIENWNGKKIVWSTSAFPNFNLSFTDNGVNFGSYYNTDQTGSEMNVTKVESDGLFVTKKMYKVTGTFKCKVAKSDESSVTTITDGEFVIRYSED